MAEQRYTLPKLAYGLSALEPIISTQIMTLHYTKHHHAYVTNLNAALQSHSHALATSNLLQHLQLQQTIKFNAGGHINHTLFWENLRPPQANNSSAMALAQTAPRLLDAIARTWGGIDEFRAAFGAVALALQGSGWVWLVKGAKAHGEGDARLAVVTSKDQDVLPADIVPVLAVDMWEHAYYLQYLNDKKGYLEGVWSVVDWTVVERRFGGGSEEVWGTLGGLVARM